MLIAAGVLQLACQHAVEPAPAQRAVAPVPIRYDVAVETMATSVHAKFDCSECHAPGAEQGAVASTYPPERTCARCHAAAARSHEQGVHARISRGRRAASCRECHGAHDIYASEDPRSHTSKQQIPITCGRCHQNPELARHLGIKPSDAARLYAESIHGRALLRGGLVVAPSCSDCHVGHDLRGASDPRSSVNPRNVNATCGRCHEGIALRLARGIHHDTFDRAEGLQGVSCVSCHSAHSIEPPLPEYKLATDRRCGSCHTAELASHLDTYHGQAHALGASDVAACYDCHGHHEILAVANPASSVSPQNKLSTCRKCHTGAPPNLAQFLAHGDRRDRATYPLLHGVYTAMTALLVSLFGIFGVHALCWSSRVLVEYLKNPSAFRSRRSERRELAMRRGFWGLRGADRFSYVAFLVSVAILVVTGLPLKYPLTAAAQLTFRWLGGAAAARELHRAGALLAFLAVTVHLARLFGAFWHRRAEFRNASGKLRLALVLRVTHGPDSPWPGLVDGRALWAHTKWFVGRGPEPVFGRFTYWEKLDYVAATLVFAVLAATGLVLWFPEVTVRFFPGFFLNVAQLIHSDEALLAVFSALTYHVLHLLVLSRAMIPKRAVDRQAPAEPLP